MADSNIECLKYLSGFGNEFVSEDERCPNSLPKGQNTPQVCPYGLYAEQVSGTAFTAPRDQNKRSWLYRIRPSVMTVPFKPYSGGNITIDWQRTAPTPNRRLWKEFPFPLNDSDVDFVKGLNTVCGAGDPGARSGVAIHVYAITSSMGDRCLYNSDGDFLVVPQTGRLSITTEFGRMTVDVKEVCVIPQGLKFSVDITERARGYVLEVYDGHFVLPELGPIGANGLANARDFLTPVARYEDRECAYQVLNKYMGRWFVAEQKHSPYDVVAWHGNYVPFKYDLTNFVSIITARFDRPDPSNGTVLTCRSNRPGVAIAEFVVMLERWHVAEHTHPMPYYHRNCMTEFLGILYGKYGSKGGQVPGGAELDPLWTPHGIDYESHVKGMEQVLKPSHVCEGAMLFMFESSLNLSLTEWALKVCQTSSEDYYKNTEYKSHFDRDVQQK